MTTEALIPTLSIEGLLNARDGAVETFKRLARELAQAAEALRAVDVQPPRVWVEHYGQRDGLKIEDQNAIRQELDRLCWASLFAKSGVRDLMSGAKREELSKLLHYKPGYGRGEEKLPELTHENIVATFEGLYESRADMFVESIEAVYKRMSWDYKTNEPNRFKEKMILSYAVRWWQSDGAAYIDHDSVLFDLERVLCTLDKQPVPSYQTGLSKAKVMRGDLHEIPGTEGPSVLSLRLFKNQNAHVYVRPDLVAQMNRLLAEKYPSRLGGTHR